MIGEIVAQKHRTETLNENRDTLEKFLCPRQMMYELRYQD